MYKEKIPLIPSKTGCYLMKNSDGVIIYVGKAKNLKKRLKSYFLGTHTGKTLMLVNDIYDFEYIVTSSEMESLILEINLIKKYNPKYNILLKDDKSYPYIELVTGTSPSLKIVRHINRKKNKNNLYGPYPSVFAARSVVSIINRLYPLKKCDHFKKDVCLYYHIKECLGYCVKKVDEDAVLNMIKDIKSFLNGNSEIVLNKINNLIEINSNSLNYEKCLELNNMKESINIILTKQHIDLSKDYNMDVFGYYAYHNYLSIQTFFIRNGILFGRDSIIINTVDDISEELEEYIINFYNKYNLIPKTIVVPNTLNINLLKDYLEIKVISPSRGEVKKVLDMASNNSKIALEEKISLLETNDLKKQEALNELKKILNVSHLSRIEAYDNSHLFGTFYVGGMVSFIDFIPKKDEYRKYKISINNNDDLSAMKEVIFRRINKAIIENTYLPDLIVLDGGMLQVKAVREVIDSFNLDILIVGLKKDSKHKTNSLILRDLTEIELDKFSNLFTYLSKIGEEVHRYVIAYHRNIRSKGALASILDMAPGIGEVRRNLLLKKFGSLKKIKAATILELNEILSKDVSEKLFLYLKDL